ncbi:hypothetical protein AAF712_006662 [Marasmius tenuissimus]|uniref:Uncharacterized protein n=1 Tax=Marasmius tenuissimus TaxID=585030 RepID=A0ABR2ZYW2_9AGAR
MPSSRLIEILSVLDASHHIQYLNISHNKYVSVKTLRAILEAHPHIHRLVLYDTSISRDDLNSMLEQERHLFFGVDELIHPSLFSSNDRERRYSAFSFFFSVPGHVPTSHKAALTSTPLLIPSVVLQSVADLIKSWIAAYEMDGIEGGQFAEVARTMPMLAGGSFPEGWMFVLILSSIWSGEPCLYGFIRTTANRKKSVYNLTSFVAELKAEGYPEPPASLVEEIEELEERLKEIVALDSQSGLFAREIFSDLGKDPLALLPLTEASLDKFMQSQVHRNYSRSQLKLEQTHYL